MTDHHDLHILRFASGRPMPEPADYLRVLDVLGDTVPDCDHTMTSLRIDQATASTTDIT